MHLVKNNNNLKIWKDVIMALFSLTLFKIMNQTLMKFLMMTFMLNHLNVSKNYPRQKLCKDYSIQLHLVKMKF